VSRLPAVSPDDCIKALLKAGFTISRQRGSHIQMRRNFPPPARTVPIPTGKKTLPRGTLSAILRQAGLTREEFLSLLE
jgi:predicted RNA binding protein YcfA (HicA-like mRNA interferase family)